MPDVEHMGFETRLLRTIASSVGSLAITAVAFQSCASLSPPVAFETATATSETTTAKQHGLRLAPVAGRPDGLVLRLAADFEVESGDRLEVRRRAGDETEQLRTVTLDAKLAERLAGEGLQFVDRSPPAPKRPERIEYRLLHRRADRERAERRVSLSVDWQQSPDRPETLSSAAATRRGVELRWQPADTSAAIYRRNVTAGQQESRRIAVLTAGSGGAYFDRDVEPDAVYAYRVALIHRHPNYLQRGARSQPLYVSVPKADD